MWVHQFLIKSILNFDIFGIFHNFPVRQKLFQLKESKMELLKSSFRIFYQNNPELHKYEKCYNVTKML